MKKLLYYVPTHFLGALLFGIYLEYQLKFWFLSRNQSLLLFLVILVGLFIIHRFHKKSWFSFFTSVFFIFFGVFSVHFQKDQLSKNHFQNISKTNAPVLLKLVKRLNPSSYSDNFIAEVTQIGSLNTKGKVLLQIQKDSLDHGLLISDFLWTYGAFEMIQAPLNPHQFSYKDYLEKLDVQQRLVVANGNWVSVNQKNFSLFRWADHLRERIQKQLKKLDFSADQLGIFNALLLGQRDEVSDELLQDYTRAGAMHILAISGLHIGILLLLFNYLLKPLEYFKNGVYFKTVLVLILLWAFALVVGLSSSVVRATSMFSFVAIAMVFKSQTAVLHSLISSLFFLVLYNPMFLFDVGFQLSYLAVFGIVFTQPILNGFWTPKWWLLRKIWQLTTVSLAAQIAVLPLSLYYFHQFPALFILSNLLIVPCLGVILFLGLLIIVLSFLNAVPGPLVTVYAFVLEAMNILIQWVSRQELFVFEEISFSSCLLVCTYTVLLFFLHYLSKPKFYKSILVLVAVLCFQAILLFERWDLARQHKLIIFHQTAHTLIAEQKGNQLSIFHNLDSIQFGQSSLLKAYRIGAQIDAQEAEDSMPSLLSFRDKQIVIVDKLGVYQLTGLKNPIVLLRESPRINLKRLIKTLQPQLIIADGSNYTSSIKEWESICKELEVCFYNTRVQGAYVLEGEK